MNKIPSGFAPISFQAMLKQFSLHMPLLGPMLWKHLGLSEDEAMPRIKSLEQKGLVQFAVSLTSEPAIFSGREPGGFNTAEDEILAELLVSFWDVTGKYNMASGQIESATPKGVGAVNVFTPEGELSLLTSVADKLVGLSLLTRDEQGRLIGPSKGQVMAWTQEHGVCDFCSDPNPQYVESVPDFQLMPGGAVSVILDATEVNMPSDSVGGWATCETCHTLVIENRRTDLLRRAVEASRGGKFTAAALKGLHSRFWRALDTKVEAAGVGAAMIDFIEDRITPEKKFVNPKLQQKTARKEAIRRLAGLTDDEMEALMKGDVLYKDVATKLASWRRRYGIDTVGEEKIAEMLNTFERPVVMPPHMLPHWQQALDRKVEIIEVLSRAEKTIADRPVEGPFTEGVGKIILDMVEDLAALRLADVYSFNADTMHAIWVASKSIPHEAPLRSVEMPMARSGWFWFAEPLPVASAPLSSDRTHALLWGWDTAHKEPTLRFSAYVVDEKAPLEAKTRDRIMPSTLWYWPLKATFHEMIEMNRHLWVKTYGPGSPESPGKEVAVGQEHILSVVEAMSLFFMQACQWFRQTVPGNPKKKIDPKLTQEAGHIERHARKRYEKAFKVTPNVRVIALRKSDKSITEDPITDGTGRKIKVRFVVSGHHRLQRCGPGRMDEKLIWIESYPKGNPDDPFQAPKNRVFAVIR